MLPWLNDAALAAQVAAQRVQSQAEHWVRAKDSVPPVPPAPVSTDFLANPTEWFAEKTDWFPGLTTEEEKAQQRQQDAAEQARQAMRVYQASSNSNLGAGRHSWGSRGSRFIRHGARFRCRFVRGTVRCGRGQRP